jgi:hypothetical protein
MEPTQRKDELRQIRKTQADKEADARRALDVKVFFGLYQAVKAVGDFHEDPTETWAGLSRVSALDFSDHLNRAIECLVSLKRGHPNEGKRPIKVS